MSTLLSSSNEKELMIETVKSEYEIKKAELERLNMLKQSYKNKKDNIAENMESFVETKHDNINYEKDYRRAYASVLVASAILANGVIVGITLAAGLPILVTVLGCGMATLLSATLAEHSTDEAMEQRTHRFANYSVENLDNLINKSQHKLNRYTSVIELIDKKREIVKSSLGYKREEIAQLYWELNNTNRATIDKNAHRTSNNKVLRLNK